MPTRHCAFVVWMAIASTIPLGADTLVLRNGQRISGELRSVRNGTIEFREEGGWSGGRTVRLNRSDVARIEFDDDTWDSGFGGTTSGNRPSGMREREVIVSADVPWNDTGIDVRAGETVYFSATGTVRWGPDRRDGPEGEKDSPSNPRRPIPSRPAAALIGRIGTTPTEIFFIGDDRNMFRMRASGRLFLGINDDYVQDNSQNFRVTVFY